MRVQVSGTLLLYLKVLGERTIGALACLLSVKATAGSELVKTRVLDSPLIFIFISSSVPPSRYPLRICKIYKKWITLIDV